MKLRSLCHRYHLFFILMLLAFTSVYGSPREQKTLVPHELKCEYLENPLGIDVFKPVLSWTIRNPSGRRGVFQKAYQIIVSESLDKLNNGIGEVWNSGRVNADQMGNIYYLGKPLKSSTKYWWKVRIWDEKGLLTNFSTPGFWIMGIMDPHDWNAKWISAEGAKRYAHQYKSAKSDFNLKRDLTEYRQYGPKPSDPNFSSMLLRRSFMVKPKIKKAVIHISGLGQYELKINGRKISEDILSPGWSDYSKTALYDTYDITSALKIGSNAIGVMLSNGMYNIQPDSIRYVKFLNTYGPLKVIAEIKIEYTDGTVQLLGTDKLWKTLPGPITYSNLFGGEDYDANLLPENWDLPTVKNEQNWKMAIECPSPGGQLKGLSGAASPIQAIERIVPVKSVKFSPNLWVYDLGQNTSVMPKIKIKGKKGAYVRIIPAELLKPDGTVDRSSATQDGVRPAWWQYTISADKSETWFPKFFYQGARYLQVELFPAPGDQSVPILEDLKGIVIHSSAKAIGHFSSSNELFNRIYSLVRWAQRSNMMSIMTDCPHREKQGWLEQYHLNGPALRYNFDLVPMFRKVMNDMSDSQLENGLVPNIAPEFFHASTDMNNGFRNSPEWGSSFIIVPWQQYIFSGDVSLMRTYFPKMKRYLAYLESTSKDNLLHTGLGDWYDIGPKPAWGSQLTPVSFTATAIYFYDHEVMSHMAGLLGLKEDSAMYAQKAKVIRAAFNKTFFNETTNRYATGSNTTYAMPLFLNIAASEKRKALTDQLVADIRGQDNSFNSGEVGFRFLLGALAKEGHSDLIYDMNNQSERPGYGYQLKIGATALTEKWDGGVGSFGSQNHFMSGQINEWFFNGLAGIGTDENGPGFRKIIIKPAIVGDLNWVKGSYQTVSGLISSVWERKDNQLSLNISIPPNTEATVYVPTINVEGIRESGRFPAKAVGVKFIKYDNGDAVYKISSGSYHFQSQLK